MSIHPSCVISKNAEIDSDVVIGPFSVIRGKARIHSGTKIESNVCIGNDFGSVVIGKNNVICAGAMVGGPPQDLKYKGEPTQLEIGDNNTIRELVTINMGTPTGTGITKIKNNCLIMSYAHVAHDCEVGNNVVIANSSQLAGHVIVEDHAKINGMCGFNQFVRVGTHCFVAGDSAVNKDVLPYTIAQGKYAVTRAPNSVGMERAGFSKDEIINVERAVRIITKGTGTMDEKIARIEVECQKFPAVEYIISFIRASERGIAIG